MSEEIDARNVKQCTGSFVWGIKMSVEDSPTFLSTPDDVDRPTHPAV